MKKKGCKSKQQQILRAFPTIWVMFFFFLGQAGELLRIKNGARSQEPIQKPLNTHHLGDVTGFNNNNCMFISII